MARKRKPAPVPYKTPARYTAEELKAAAIADLESDIRCAERDGLTGYAAQCRAELAAAKEQPANTDWARWLFAQHTA